MKIVLTLFLGAFAMACASTSTTEVTTTEQQDNGQGYRLICRAAGHPGHEVHVGPCRDSKLLSMADMQSHADAYHSGSLFKMTYTARCDLP